MAKWALDKNAPFVYDVCTMLLRMNPEGEHPQGENGEVPRFSVSAAKEQGPKNRQEDFAETHEDAERGLGIYVVADGVGGSSHGEFAALVASTDVVKRIRELETISYSGIKNAVGGTHRELLTRIELLQKSHNSPVSASTTLSGLVRIKDAMYFFHVGDSRIYQLSGERLTQLTHDDTQLNQIIADGGTMHDDAARDHFENIITQAIGGSDIPEVQVEEVHALPGDTFLLMTDGAHRKLEKNDLPALVKKCPKGLPLAKFLIEIAKQRKLDDNALILAVEWNG